MQSFYTIKHIEHYLLWGFLFLFIFDYHFFEENILEALLWTSMELSSFIVIFYFNYLVLIPLFLKKEKFVAYLIAILLTIIAYIFIIRVTGIEGQLYEGSPNRNVFSIVLNTGLFLLLSTFYHYYKEWQLEKELQEQTNQEKLATELQFLKAQVSPHFLFNTLNNIYGLSQQQHPNAAPMVAKLSGLLRYTIYEGAAKFISLTKEVQQIKDYISLQLLGKPVSKNVDFYTEGILSKQRIIPILLLNFVENSFKHSGINHQKEAWIKISCVVNELDHLKFSISNTVYDLVKKEAGGIGLSNFKRQLELNYPKRYTLSTKQEAGVFYLDLNIQLNESI